MLLWKVYLNPSQSLGTCNELDKPSPRPSGYTTKGDHLQIKSMFPPQFVHNTHLKEKQSNVA
jgi:hypothetical protein